MKRSELEFCDECGGSGKKYADIFSPDLNGDRLHRICPTCHGSKFKPVITKTRIEGVPEGYEFDKIFSVPHRRLAKFKNPQGICRYERIPSKIDQVEPVTEIRIIPNFPERYRAGSDGLIYTRGRDGTEWDKPLATSTGKDNGYLTSQFYINKKCTVRNIHRLICSAFYGEPTKEKNITRHLDGDKTNNKPENMIWGNQIENYADSKLHGTNIEGEKQWLSKFTNIERNSIKWIIEKNICSETHLARVLNVVPGTIRNIISKNKSSKTSNLNELNLYVPLTLKTTSIEVDRDQEGFYFNEKQEVV